MNVILLIRDTHTHAGKNSSGNMEGVGKASSSERGSCPLFGGGEWLASWTPAACFRGGRGQRKQLLFGGAPQPHCQHGPLPLPSASDTTWQKQSYSRRKRGAPPSADRQRGFSNLSLHCWAPARQGQAPLKHPSQPEWL